MTEQRRSIQDIIPPARSKPIRAAATEETPASPPPRRPATPKKKREKGAKGSGGLLIIALGVIGIVGAAFGIVSTVFHRAEVTLELNQFPVSIAETFEASPNGELLSFSEERVEVKKTTSVPQSGSEYVEDRASGTITVFNEYSKTSQRLITNTRFEGPDGLIYRIKSPVVVPGYTTKDGKTVPGQIQVTVYADEPGEKYNITSAEFSIPGLKGSAQYDTMYARSEGALSGGFVGERAVVEKSVRDAAVSELKTAAEKEAREKLAANAGEGVLIFPDTISVDFVEYPDAAGVNGAEVSLSAVATAPGFSEEMLARVIANEGGVLYEAPLSIANRDMLIFKVEPSETTGNLTVTVSGDALLVGTYDQDKLLADLAGKDRRSVGVVLSGYPAIADMRISVYPFWRGVLPDEVSRINLKVEEGNGGGPR